MTLYVMRHGETLWNQQYRIQGWLDSPLTVMAKKQLQVMQLPQLENPIIYSSDLGRAAHSAASISARIGVKVIEDSRLRERCFGLLQGKIIDREENLSKAWYDYHHRYVKPIEGRYGIEPELDFVQRIIQFKEYLTPILMDHDVILVSHGEWLRAFNNTINKIPHWQQGAGIPKNNQIVSVF